MPHLTREYAFDGKTGPNDSLHVMWYMWLKPGFPRRSTKTRGAAHGNSAQKSTNSFSLVISIPIVRDNSPPAKGSA